MLRVYNDIDVKQLYTSILRLTATFYGDDTYSSKLSYSVQ